MINTVMVTDYVYFATKSLFCNINGPVFLKQTLEWHRVSYNQIKYGNTVSKVKTNFGILFQSIPTGNEL